jgi:Cu/Ag efflux protein CusF
VKQILTATAAVFVLLLPGACRRATEATAAHHYPMTGKVMSLDAKEQTAKIDAAAIPNFMDAMTMDYPIKSKAEFGSLHVGDNIAATVNVSADGTYDVSGIHVQSAGK